ncbi:MAG: DUF4363 family protein [Clostridia bacterium]|nr:DUF4363 family protein [Clostridia bacterium]
MKRTAAAVILLAFAVFLSLWSGYVFRREMSSLLYSVEEIIDCAETENDLILNKKTGDLLRKWEKSSVILHSIVMHEGMDVLEENITALPIIIEHSDREEFKLKCIEAINQIENLLNAEKISIENIL